MFWAARADDGRRRNISGDRTLRLYTPRTIVFAGMLNALLKRRRAIQTEVKGASGNPVRRNRVGGRAMWTRDFRGFIRHRLTSDRQCAVAGTLAIHGAPRMGGKRNPS